MRTAIRLCILALAALTAGAVFVAEGALHIWQREPPDDRLAASISQADGAGWHEVQVRAADGVTFSGWQFTPRQGNGAAVIALHGVGDTRAGMLGHADFLLRAGYTVLAPDCQGHGRSGGDVISYGVREGDDVRAWEDLLLRTPGSEASMESGNRWARRSCWNRWHIRRGCAHWWRTARSRPFKLVNLGFVYARARYGVNLSAASPVNAVRSTHVPVLLVHGTKDTNIVPRHSRELHAANLAATELWEVPGAGHIASPGIARGEYVRRVTEWFDRHR